MIAVKAEDSGCISAESEEGSVSETEHSTVADEQIEAHRHEAEDQHAGCKSRQVGLSDDRRHRDEDQCKDGNRRGSIEAQHLLTPPGAEQTLRAREQYGGHQG